MATDGESECRSGSGCFGSSLAGPRAGWLDVQHYILHAIPIRQLSTVPASTLQAAATTSPSPSPSPDPLLTGLTLLLQDFELAGWTLLHVCIAPRRV